MAAARSYLTINPATLKEEEDTGTGFILYLGFPRQSEQRSVWIDGRVTKTIRLPDEPSRTEQQEGNFQEQFDALYKATSYILATYLEHKDRGAVPPQPHPMYCCNCNTLLSSPDQIWQLSEAIYQTYNSVVVYRSYKVGARQGFFCAFACKDNPQCHLQVREFLKYCNTTRGMRKITCQSCAAFQPVWTDILENEDDWPTHDVAFRQCSRCLNAYYCSPQCQRLDWKERHKKACVPHQGDAPPMLLVDDDEEMEKEKEMMPCFTWCRE